MVRLYIREDEGVPTLDLLSVSPDATVQDLIDALQEATDDPTVYKPQLKPRYGICAGCVDNCCRQYEIYPDLISANKIAQAKNLSLKDYAKRHLDRDKDLYFLKFTGKPCPHLKDNLCTIYPFRPIICRLFLCTPMTDDLENLRASVSYMGESALIVELLKTGLLAPTYTYKHRLKNLKKDLSTKYIKPDVYTLRAQQLYLMYKKNPFLKEKSYENIYLKDCCPTAFWEDLLDR